MEIANIESEKIRPVIKKRLPLDQIINFKVDIELVEEFDIAIANARKTRSEVIREALIDWLGKQSQKAA